ncbi:MAG: glycerophosphodiester phosphodiesterase, partial [Burkholderiales bacterium]|nr:glycerophosphodiester phosphodiesterase [Anaerolineae bacterium]
AAVTLLQRADALRYCSIASFDPNCLQAIRTWEPLLPVNLDPEPQDGSLTPWELVQQCLRCGANFMGHTYRTLTPAIVHEAHSHGMGLWVWTVNDAAAMRDMLNMGVDAILSDDPALLKMVLAER